MKAFNKKAMMDDVFDFFFTIIAAIFLYFFISAALMGGIKNSNEKSLTDISDFKRIDSGINNLRVQNQEGIRNLELLSLDKVVKESKVLGGKIITTCRDYLNQQDCTTDVVRVNMGREYCSWDESGCHTIVPVEVG